jgi:hypothetical protein
MKQFVLPVLVLSQIINLLFSSTLAVRLTLPYEVALLHRVRTSATRFLSQFFFCHVNKFSALGNFAHHTKRYQRNL